MSLLVTSLVTAGCDRGAEHTPSASSPIAAAPTSQPAAPAAPPTAAPPTAPPMMGESGGEWQPSDPKVARFIGLVGDKPATWIEHPPEGMMRAANYTVPGQNGGEAAHIVVFKNIGGSVQANIDRWQGQFQPDENGNPVQPQISKFEVDGIPVTLVELEGSWMKMGANWYTPDQLFVTAVLELPQGNVFVRFAGQTDTVLANRADFVNMIHSLHKDTGQ